MLRPAPGVRIPLEEVEIRVSRSSGPGGQHANVTASRVEAVFDVRASQSLGEAARERVLARLGPVVRAVSQDSRSQMRNRDVALARLEQTLAGALRVPKKRSPTKPTRASKERRLQAKRRQASRKAERRRPADD